MRNTKSLLVPHVGTLCWFTHSVVAHSAVGADRCFQLNSSKMTEQNKERHTK